MLSFPFLDLFFTWKGLLALPHVIERNKNGRQRERKLSWMGEKKMFHLAKPGLSAKNKEEMNDKSQNVT